MTTTADPKSGLSAEKGIALSFLGGLLLSFDVPLLKLSGADTWTIIYIRGTMLFISLFLFWLFANRLRENKTPFINGKTGYVIAALAAVSNIMFVASISLTSVANVVFILAFNPMFAGLLGWLFLNERLGTATWIAIGCSLGGVLLIVADGLQLGTWQGDLLALGVAVTMAASLTIIRYSGTNQSLSAGAGHLLSAIVAAPLAVPGSLTATGWRRFWSLARRIARRGVAPPQVRSNDARGQNRPALAPIISTSSYLSGWGKSVHRRRCAACPMHHIALRDASSRVNRFSAIKCNCAPVAGKSTLNRLELSPAEPTPYHKISYDAAAIEALFVELFVEAHHSAPPQIVLDLDATDDPLHGHQEGRFFHGYYDGYCYLPLYIFCGRHLLTAKLRRSNIDAAAGAREEVARLVAQIRVHWPQVRIMLRGDSGFAREQLMAWCEANGVDYLFGLQRNRRLTAHIEAELAAARRAAQAKSRPVRRFKDFTWSTLDTWSCRRRVVAKAEWMPGRGENGANPRFVVTSLRPDEIRAHRLYQTLYCARGEMENRIKECQLDLFADRTSACSMHANQLRLWFASMAYVLMCALRRIGLAHTRFARATCGRIRRALLKGAALVRISVRRIKFALATACPYQAEFRCAHHRLTAAAA